MTRLDVLSGLPREVRRSMRQHPRSHHGDRGTSEAEDQAEECPPQDQRHRQATEDPERGPTPWGTFHDHEADGPEQHDREEGGAAHLVAVAVRPEVRVEGEGKQEAPKADEPDDAPVNPSLSSAVERVSAR